MKFLKLTVENFKPYFNKQEIVLYTQMPDKPITINVGPNEHGKTSALDAVLWTIYGTNYQTTWKDWVNWVAQKIYDQKEGIVPFSTQLEIKLDDGINYQILRKAEYNTKTKAQGNDELTVLKQGTPMTPEESQKWMVDNFPPQNIVRYYLFSAENMLSEFEKEHNIAVKNHINVITGIETLAMLRETVGEIVTEYESQKDTIRKGQSGFDATTYSRLKQDKSTKEGAIELTEKEIQGLEDKKKKIFPQAPNQKEKEIVKNFKDFDNLENEKRKLEESFATAKLAKKAQYIFISEIITKCVGIIENQSFSKEDFDAATKVIQQSLGTTYSGITTEGEIKLLDRPAYTKLGKTDLKDINTLTFQAGNSSSKKLDDLTLFQGYGQQANTQVDNMSKLIASFLEKEAGQRQINQSLTTLGAQGNKSLVLKVEEWQGYVQDVTDKNTLIANTERELIETEKDITEMEENQKLDKKSERQIAFIDSEINNINTILKVWKKTDQVYSQELIDKVSVRASELFLKIVKDGSKKYKGIKITEDYEIQVLNINGDPIHKEQQLNKGTLEQAFFCFLLSLPTYAHSTKIPLFLDNPLMRLDAGNKKRLVEALASIDTQVIMNLIPGSEYHQDQYNKWFKQHVNTQNWCARVEDTKYNTGYYVNNVTNEDAKTAIPYRDEDM